MTLVIFSATSPYTESGGRIGYLVEYNETEVWTKSSDKSKARIEEEIKNRQTYYSG